MRPEKWFSAAESVDFQGYGITNEPVGALSICAVNKMPCHGLRREGDGRHAAFVRAIRLRPTRRTLVRTKAVSPLRFATAVHDLAEFHRGLGIKATGGTEDSRPSVRTDSVLKPTPGTGCRANFQCRFATAETRRENASHDNPRGVHSLNLEN